MTWDVDSRDRATCARLQRFIYGYTLSVDGKIYRYPGFVEREGVRYLGQSVLLVRNGLADEIAKVLAGIGVDFEMDRGAIG